LKEENSIRGETSGISLKESSSRGEASRKTTWDMKWIKVLQEGERVHSNKARDGPSHDGKC